MRRAAIQFILKCSIVSLLLLALLLVDAHLLGELSLFGLVALLSPCLLGTRFLWLLLAAKAAPARKSARPAGSPRPGVQTPAKAAVGFGAGPVSSKRHPAA